MRTTKQPTQCNIEPLITEKDVAAITGLTVATIRRYRHLRLPPPYIKLGKNVRYDQNDIRAWLAAAATEDPTPR